MFSKNHFILHVFELWLLVLLLLRIHLLLCCRGILLILFIFITIFLSLLCREVQIVSRIVIKHYLVFSCKFSWRLGNMSNFPVLLNIEPIFCIVRGYSNFTHRSLKFESSLKVLLISQKLWKWCLWGKIIFFIFQVPQISFQSMLN